MDKKSKASIMNVTSQFEPNKDQHLQMTSHAVFRRIDIWILDDSRESAVGGWEIDLRKLSIHAQRKRPSSDPAHTVFKAIAPRKMSRFGKTTVPQIKVCQAPNYKRSFTSVPGKNRTSKNIDSLDLSITTVPLEQLRLLTITPTLPVSN